MSPHGEIAFAAERKTGHLLLQSQKLYKKNPRKTEQHALFYGDFPYTFIKKTGYF